MQSDIPGRRKLSLRDLKARRGRETTSAPKEIVPVPEVRAPRNWSHAERALREAFAAEVERERAVEETQAAQPETVEAPVASVQPVERSAPLPAADAGNPEPAIASTSTEKPNKARRPRRMARPPEAIPMTPPSEAAAPAPQAKSKKSTAQPDKVAKPAKRVERAAKTEEAAPAGRDTASAPARSAAPAPKMRPAKAPTVSKTKAAKKPAAQRKAPAPKPATAAKPKKVAAPKKQAAATLLPKAAAEGQQIFFQKPAAPEAVEPVFTERRQSTGSGWENQQLAYSRLELALAQYRQDHLAHRPCWILTIRDDGVCNPLPPMERISGARMVMEAMKSHARMLVIGTSMSTTIIHVNEGVMTLKNSPVMDYGHVESYVPH